MDFFSSLFSPGLGSASSEPTRRRLGYGPVAPGSTLGMQRSNFRAQDEEMAQQNFAQTIGGLVQILAFMNAMKGKQKPIVEKQQSELEPFPQPYDDPFAVNFRQQQDPMMLRYMQMMQRRNPPPYRSY